MQHNMMTSRGRRVRLLTAFTMSLCLLAPGVPSVARTPRTPSAASPPASPVQSESTSIRQYSLAANDLAYSAQTQKIYASVPSSAGARGNSITEIIPATGALGQSVFVGSEPGQIALADAAQILYVALDGAGAVRRFDIPTLAAGPQFALEGAPSSRRPLTASDMAIAPGNPNLLAVARASGPFTSEGGVAVFDNGVQRPVTTPGFGFTSRFLAFSDSASKLYGDGLNTMTIDASGVSNITATTSFSVGDAIQFAGGRVYSSRGQVVDPDAATLLGTFAVGNSDHAFVVDVSVGRAYFVTGNAFGGGSRTLKAFDINTFVLVGEAPIPGIVGEARSLVRWGANGLAFRTNAGQLFIIQTTLIPSSEPVPAPTPTPSPTPTPAPFVASISRVPLVTNDLVYNPARQSFHASVPSSAGAGGNSVVELNPATGALSAPVFVGSEPNKLAVSDDGTALYVGLDGANSVRRFDTATQSPGLQFDLGGDPSDGPFKPGEMEVMPGSPGTVAVVQRSNSSFSGGVAVYDNGTQRPEVARSFNQPSDLKFAAGGTRLYGNTQKMSVSPSGVALDGDIPFTSPSSLQIDFQNGLHYTSEGTVVEPEAGVLRGTFTGLNSNGAPGMAVDVAHNRVFFLISDISRMVIRAYELDTFRPVGSVTIEGVFGTPNRLWRWGVNGLAFRTDNAVVLLQTALVDASSPVPSPTPTPSPTPFPTPTPEAPNFVRELSLPAHDLLLHQPSQTLYLSVPSTAGARGNTLTQVNPATGALGQSVFVGSEPGRMAMSSDHQVIYAALGGAAAIRRFDIPTQTAGLQFPIGQEPFGGRNFTANDMAVAPGDPNLLAVARHLGGSPPEAGVAVFDSGAQRPVTTPGHIVASSFLAFSDSPATVYGGGFDSGLNTMTIAADGVRVTGTTPFDVGASIEFRNGLVYSSRGQVVNPSTGQLVGTFNGLSSFGLTLTVDTALGRVFFVSESGDATLLRAYDLNTFLPLGSVRIPTGGGFPTRLVRWGTNGLAFRLGSAGFSGQANRAFIVQSTLVSAAGSLPTGVQFSQANFGALEGNDIFKVTVSRTGDLGVASSVRYATSDGTANTRSHYTAARGTLTFAPGERSKTFPILLTENAFVEGPKTVVITLSDAQGAELLPPQAVTLTINDNDFSSSTFNPIDDATTFVRQHYHDFLNREPDPAGLDFWRGGIQRCGADAQCRQVKRVDTSAAFFLSIEFQETGYLVYRMYKAAYGDLDPPAVPVPVRLAEFLADSQQIGGGIEVGVGEWQAQLEANKNAFASEFVARQRFLDAFPQSLTAEQFVDALGQNTGGALSQAERDQLVADLSSNAKTRAQVLRAVAEDQTLRDAEFRKAFVLMQYFGYLRRDPDGGQDAPFGFAGFNFWLGKLNEFDGDFRRAEMVRAFIESIEYRQRFGQ
jgi:Calx-beta domain